MKATRTAWLARPGIPMLVEVQERSAFSKEPKFIEEVRLPFTAEQFRIVDALRSREMVLSSDGGLHLCIGGLEINAELLLGRR